MVEQQREELVEADPEESAEAFMARREASRKKSADAPGAPAAPATPVAPAAEAAEATKVEGA